MNRSPENFWVDVYINPVIPPATVNETLATLNAKGFIWGVTGVILNPGESLQLSLNDQFYFPDQYTADFPLTVGLPVYAQVDSANANTTYGAIHESHEKSGGPYNNIIMSTIR